MDQAGGSQIPNGSLLGLLQLGVTCLAACVTHWLNMAHTYSECVAGHVWPYYCVALVLHGVCATSCWAPLLPPVKHKVPCPPVPFLPCPLPSPSPSYTHTLTQHLPGGLAAACPASKHPPPAAADGTCDTHEAGWGMQFKSISAFWTVNFP